MGEILDITNRFDFCKPNESIKERCKDSTKEGKLITLMFKEPKTQAQEKIQELSYGLPIFLKKIQSAFKTQAEVRYKFSTQKGEGVQIENLKVQPYQIQNADSSFDDCLKFEMLGIDKTKHIININCNQREENFSNGSKNEKTQYELFGVTFSIEYI